MQAVLVSPPAVFIILFAIIAGGARLARAMAFKRTVKLPAVAGASYACGEDNYDHRLQPDYSGFFRFAFFFTIAHVAALMITTAPVGSLRTFVVSLLYIEGVIIGLLVLLRG